MQESLYFLFPIMVLLVMFLKCVTILQVFKSGPLFISSKGQCPYPASPDVIVHFPYFGRFCFLLLTEFNYLLHRNKSITSEFNDGFPFWVLQEQAGSLGRSGGLYSHVHRWFFSKMILLVSQSQTFCFRLLPDGSYFCRYLYL